jgi:hypothetical protein
MTLEDIDIDMVDNGIYEGKMIRDTVNCCLCPLSHGGIKPTTDGRWVHIACALWSCASNEVEILDMKDMSPIDITRLSFISLKDNTLNRNSSYIKRQQLLTGSASGSSLSDELQTSSSSTSSCIYCNQAGGYLVNCTFHEKTDETNTDNDWNSGSFPSCKRSFHPLCGWFSGCYMKASITDDSFEGKERNGKYPSGINYCFLCNNHSENERINTTVQYQRTLRNKYRMNENDLEQIPGKNNRKKRKKSAKDKKAGREGGSGGRKTTSSSSQPKELAIDSYGENMCACCLKPTSNDVFGNGYESEKFSEIQVLVNDSAPDAASSSSSSALPLVNSDPDHIPFQLASSSSSSFSSLVPSSSGHAITYTVSNSIVSCSKCHVTLHKECLLEYHTFSYFDNESTWICDVCSESEGNTFPPSASSSLVEAGPYSYIHCALCPRRGGFLCHTVDDRWVHAFCAKNIPASIRINSEKRIDIRLISKESKKQKCFICNRKGNGICIGCNAVGCSTFFHPLCALRNGKGYIEVRNGIKEAYCYEHIPNGIEFLNGFWLNGSEIYRFRYCLDRARLVLDMLVRREKLKKTLCKTETDLFSSKIIRMLDKAKGRKTQRYRSGSMAAGGEEGEESGLVRYDSDEEGEEGGGEGDDNDEEDDDEEEDDSSIDEELFEEFVPLDYLYERKKKEKSSSSSSSAESKEAPSSSSSSSSAPVKPHSVPMTAMMLSDGETTVDISKTWLNRHTKRLPDAKSMRKNMIVYFAGVDIKEKHSQMDKKAFFRHQKDFISLNEEKLRSRTGFFSSKNAEETFSNNLNSSLIKLMKCNEKEFKIQIAKIDEKLEIQFKKVHRKQEETLSIITSPLTEKKKSRFFHEKAKAKGKGKRKGKRSSTTKGEEGSGAEDEEYPDEEGSEEENDEIEGEQPVKKKSKLSLAAAAVKEKEIEFENSTYFKQMISFFPSILDSASTSTGDVSSVSDSTVKTKKRGVNAFIEDDDNEEQEEPEETKDEGFDRYLRQLNLSQSSTDDENHQINLMEWKVVSNEEELISLERLIFDMINCLSSYYIYSYDDASSHYPDHLLDVSLMEYITRENGLKDRIVAAASNSGSNSGSFVLKTPMKQEETDSLRAGKPGQKRRNSNNSSSVFLDEEEVTVKAEKGKSSSNRSTAKVSPINSKHQKPSLSLAVSSPIPDVSVKKGKKGAVVDTIPVPEGRLLCEEFQDIPFPEYSNYVRRIMTFSIMRGKLHSHHYLSFASFTSDFYLLLNNAKSVATAASVTWRDIKLLLKLFNESRSLFATQSYSSMKGNFNSVRCSLLKKQSVAVKKESSSSVIPSTPTISTRKKFVNSSSKHDEQNGDTTASRNNKANQFTCNCCKKKVGFI